MYKRFLRIILVCVFAITAATGVQTSFASNGDMPSSWAADKIFEVQEKGILNPDVFSNYKANITRKDFAYLAYTLYQQIKGQPIFFDPSEDTDVTFTDTDDFFVRAVKKEGIIGGYGDGRFGPNDPITREQLAKMFIVTLQKAGAEVSILSTDKINFTDSDKISSWASDYIIMAYKYGVLNGVGNNKIDPKGNATREQSIIMFNRIIENPVLNNTMGNKGGFVQQAAAGSRKMTELIQDGTTEYYTDSEYWDTSYLMKKEQGKEPVLLDESDVLYLAKEGDFIYYTVVDYDRDWNAFLYRIKTDGTEKQSLGDTPVGAFTVYDDWIYYTNLDDGSKIYRMTVDGLKNEKIIDVPAKELICADGRIIFNGQDDSKFEAMMDISSGKIYMADLDGSNIIKITDNLAYDIEVVDNNVYYSNVSNNFELSSNKLSEGSNTVGLNVKSLDFDIIDGWIYYGSKDDVFKMDTEMIKKDFPTLHKIMLDGSGDVKLTDVPSTSIYVSENTIRYHEYADGGTMSYDIRHTEPRK